MSKMKTRQLSFWNMKILSMNFGTFE